MDRPVPTPANTPAIDPAPAQDARPAAPLAWYWELTAHVTAAVLTVAILVVGLRLTVADLSAPFQYHEDVLLILPLVKSTLERGSHWRCERLGAPGIQELHDFPIVDHLHLGIIWLIGRFESDPVVVFNLFHLLTYPLTTVTTMFVLRRFGLSIPAAAAGGILYAFTPYHVLRGEVHYFLSAYFVIPLTMMVALWVCQGRLPFFRRDPDGRYRLALLTRDALAAVVIAAATSMAGAYYAFYGCAMLSVAALYGWVVLRTWRAALSAAGVIAVIVVGGFLNHVPTFVYQYHYGQNSRPTQRWAEEAEMYGMKISQLVLPTPNHNNIELGKKTIWDIAGVRTRYADATSRPLHQFEETNWNALGAVGALGFVGLLAAAVWPGRRAWPIGPLAALTVFGTLFGTVGGLGDLFNFLITPQIRCHNRISIFLAFFALFAVCWAIDRYFRSRRGWAAWLHGPAFAALIAFGIWDQTDDTWFPQTRPRANKSETDEPLPDKVLIDKQRRLVAERFRADRRFFQRVEDRLPEGMVFCYPIAPFPETAPYDEPGSPGKIGTYDHVRGYLHTERLRWSFGAMKGREWDAWAREVGGKPVPEMVERLVKAGFDGLVIDSRGLNPTRFAGILGELDRILEGQDRDRPQHEDGSLHFIDLRPFRHYLERTYGKAGFADASRREVEAVQWLWLKGFDCYEPIGYERRQRWCKSVGQVVIVNPSDQPKKVAVSMVLHTWFGTTAPLRISGAVWAEELNVNMHGVAVNRELTIPPGRHTVWFRCDTPPGYTFPDARDLVFGVKDFSLREVP